MTCVAGLVAGHRVYMAADSAGIAGWDLSIRSDPKVFINGEFIFGFTTSFRMGQLLHHALTPPAPSKDQDLSEFMCTTFVDAVRACLTAGGLAEKKNERESAGQFLVGFRGRLFEVDSDYQVGENRDNLAAIGCGAGYALGSLDASQDYQLRPTERLRLALRAAIRFSAGVAGPVVVASR